MRSARGVPALAIKRIDEWGIDAISRRDALGETIDGHITKIQQPPVERIWRVILVQQAFQDFGSRFRPLLLLVKPRERQRASKRRNGIGVWITHHVRGHRT